MSSSDANGSKSLIIEGRAAKDTASRSPESNSSGGDASAREEGKKSPARDQQEVNGSPAILTPATGPTFSSIPDGCQLIGVDGQIVNVVRREYCYEIQSDHPYDYEPRRVGLYCYGDLVGHLGNSLRGNFSNYLTRRPGERKQPMLNREVLKAVHASWKELLRKTAPDVRRVQKSVFSATLTGSDILWYPGLYAQHHLVEDICRYRAAAIATAYWRSLAKWLMYRRDEYSGNEVFSNPNFEQELRDCLLSWQELFSCRGNTYGSLRRTLTNLPGGVPSRLVPHLANFYLRRPYTNRLELLLSLILVKVTRRFLEYQAGLAEAHYDVVFHAREEQIREAMARASAALGVSWSTRRVSDIQSFVGFLLEFPERHNGGIVGLTEKAIRHYRTERRAKLDKTLEELGMECQTASPAIALPETPGLIFLDTVSGICEEALAMKHCAEDYAADAVQGNCYLFRVEHGGERATVQVCPQKRRVLQAVGPRNQQNQAAAWGKRQLDAWAKKLPRKSSRNRAVAFQGAA